MEDIISSLKNEKIDFIVNEEGFVTWNNKYDDKVKNLIKKLKERPVVYLKREKDAKEICKLLDAKNIHYELKVSNNGEFHLYWNKENDEEIREIIRQYLNI